MSPPNPQASADWNATSYDRVADPQTRWGAEVLERLPLEGDETVLDAGCGTGRVTELLLARLPHGSESGGGWGIQARFDDLDGIELGG